MRLAIFGRPGIKSFLLLTHRGLYASFANRGQVSGGCFIRWLFGRFILVRTNIPVVTGYSVLE